MKKITALILTLAMLVPMWAMPAHAQEEPLLTPNSSRQILVQGNRLVYADSPSEQVVLRGVNVPSMGWGMAEHLYESMIEMMDGWNSNVIRFPVQPKYWENGRTDMVKDEDGNDIEKVVQTKEQYRKNVDDMVKAAAARGKYIILDCHTYVMPIQETLDFWLELCGIYGNNPAVLFGLLNEPHDIKPNGNAPQGNEQWEIWRNGGTIGMTVDGEWRTDVEAIGHQTLVEKIRDTGAKNILVAGGINWAYDISGIAKGYALTDCASNGNTEKAGYGIIYDSHIYPGKSGTNRDGWDATLGAVRKIAPVLIGEWGWDSSDKNVTGNTASTSEIYMTQLLKWMDDEYHQYDGVPINWTAWNLHMKSSPRMITDWNFKPTAFNGLHIKNRLLSYENTAVLKNAIKTIDFSEDIFRGFSNTKPSYEIAGGTLNIKHDIGEGEVKAHLPADLILNGVQTITLDVTGTAGDTLKFGFYTADCEEWTVERTLSGGKDRFTISLDELALNPDTRSDGVFRFDIDALYFGTETAKKGTISVDTVSLQLSQNPVLLPKSYTAPDKDLIFDLDSVKFGAVKNDYKGPAATSQFYTVEDTIPGPDGKLTKVLRTDFNRIDGGWGGYSNLNFAQGQRTSGAKYFSMCVKGSGTAQRLDIKVGSAGIQIFLDEGDTQWRQYIFDISDQIADSEDIAVIQLNSGTKIADTFYTDNFMLTKEYPEIVAPLKQRTVSYGFERAFSSKHNPVFYSIDGGEGDRISGEIIEDGAKSPNGYLIRYNRGTGAPAKAVISYKKSSDFFKARPNFKADSELTTNFVFDAKSITGKNERVGVMLSDAVYETYTQGIEVELTPEWKRYTIPIRNFILSDCGFDIEPGRIREILFYAVQGGTSGAFMVDNFIQTSDENLEQDSSWKTVYKNDFDRDVFEENGGTWTVHDTTGEDGAVTDYFHVERVETGGWQDSAALYFTDKWAKTEKSGTPVNYIELTGAFPADWDFSKALYVGAMMKGDYIHNSAKKVPNQANVKIDLYKDELLTGSATLDFTISGWSWSTAPFALNSKTNNSDEVIAQSNRMVISMPSSLDCAFWMDELTFSFVPQERKGEIREPADYNETFESYLFNFQSGGLTVSDSEYFKVVDTKGITGDGGQNIQQILPNMPEELPYIYGNLPKSWDISRSTHLKFDAKLMTDESAKGLWRTNHSVGFDLSYCQETLTPVFALADIYGNEYKAQITLDTSEQKQYEIPLSSFVNEQGKEFDPSKIRQVRIYPDQNVIGAAYHLDDFGFFSDGTQIEEIVFTGILSDLENGVTPGAHTVTAQFAGNDYTRKTYTLVSAVYDSETGALVDCSYREQKIDKDNLELSLPMNLGEGAYTVKVFLWNAGLEGMRPVNDKKAFVQYPQNAA